MVFYILYSSKIDILVNQAANKELNTIISEQLLVGLARVEKKYQREETNLLILPGDTRVLGNIDEVLHELRYQVILIVALLIVQLKP